MQYSCYAPDMETEATSLLADAERAFERGDYKTVRLLCNRAIASSDADTARAAEVLLRRTQPDPAQILVLVGCLLFFAWAVWRYAL